MAFKIVEGFFTIVTLVQCLTGGAAEFADAVRVIGIAMRALNTLF